MALNRDESGELWPSSEVPATLDHDECEPPKGNIDPLCRVNSTLQTHGSYGDIQIPTNYDANGFAPAFAPAFDNYGLHDTAPIGWQGNANNYHTDAFDYLEQVNYVPGGGSLQPAPIASGSPNYTSSAAWNSPVDPTSTAEVDLFTQWFGETVPFLEQYAVANTRPRVGNNVASSSTSAAPLRLDSVARVPDGQEWTLQDEVAGVYYATSESVSSATNKRRKRTQDELKSSQKVRAGGGACLRCYVQNARCDAGRPCPACKIQFCKARKSKGFSWTGCVSANLSDLNIFVIGVTVPKEHQGNTSGAGHSQRLDKACAMSLYKKTIEPKSDWDTVVQMEELYSMVLGYVYGPRASDVHPFILETSNPLYTLVQLNVILLKSPLLNTGSNKHIEFLHNLRAISSIAAFECIGRELRRGTLAAASPERQSALILQFALLLDQVVETKGDHPRAGIAVAQRESFDEMREHLIHFVSYYLHRLMPISLKDLLMSSILEGTRQGHLGDEYWGILSDFLPHISLRKPPVLKSRPIISRHACADELQVKFLEVFLEHCFLSCS